GRRLRRALLVAAALAALRRARPPRPRGLPDRKPGARRPPPQALLANRARPRCARTLDGRPHPADHRATRLGLPQALLWGRPSGDGRSAARGPAAVAQDLPSIARRQLRRGAPRAAPDS